MAKAKNKTQRKKSVPALVKSHKTIRPDLSIQEIRFCQAYATNNQNAMQAYRDAGFPNPPPNDNALGVRAFKVLRRAKVREYIQDLKDAACEAAKVTTEDLARAWREQAYADRTKIYNADGTMKPPGQWPMELRSLIVGLETITDGLGKTTWKVKFERSTEAKKVLSQWRGMIGGDKDAEADKAPVPLVIGGGDPESL